MGPRYKTVSKSGILNIKLFYVKSYNEIQTGLFSKSVCLKYLVHFAIACGFNEIKNNTND
jgi:hypothetical protein